MPSTIHAWHELDQFAITADQKVRGNAPVGNITKVGVSLRIKTIGKQLGDRISAKASGRQADVVDYQQFDGAFSRASVAIRRSDLPGTTQDTGAVDSPATPRASAAGSRTQLIPRRSIR